MAVEKPAKGEPALMKDLFFDPPEATGGKWKCKLCEGALTWRGSNSGYSAFVQHMKGPPEGKDSSQGRALERNKVVINFHHA